jgi:hypothetical protein
VSPEGQQLRATGLPEAFTVIALKEGKRCSAERLVLMGPMFHGATRLAMRRRLHSPKRTLWGGGHAAGHL